MVFDYNSEFSGIAQILRENKGSKSKVAILDTGIDKDHESFTNADIKTDPNADTVDKEGHGTHCTGIIGARNGRISGIAPRSGLFVSQASDRGITSVNLLNSGLRWAIETADVDVINISLGLDKNEKDDPVLLSLIATAFNKNIILVASAGENKYLLKTSAFLYPAFHQNVIAVGAIDESMKDISPGGFNEKLDYLMPYQDILSCFPGNTYEKLSGSSMAAAFVSGIVGLIKSNASNPKSVALSEVKKQLDTICIRMSPNIDFKNALQLIKP